MQLPKELTTVTPLSKILAIILFIMFPFIGFWLGLKYQANFQPARVEEQSINIQPSPIISITASIASDSIPSINNIIINDVLKKKDRCLTYSDVNMNDWGMYHASRDYLINIGYHSDYLDKHFCPLQIDYDKQLSWASVTYKASFEPYYGWWQHGFPVVKDENSIPKLVNGHASVDFSCKACVLKIPVTEIKNTLSAKQLYDLMLKLIGPFDEPLHVGMGPGIGKNTMRLYATASNKNPKSTSCADTERGGNIDIETGEGSVSYDGACREFLK